jgi:hydroxypyruvate reductase
VHVIAKPLIGQARAAAHAYLLELEHLVAALPHPLCVLSSGETTVHVTGTGKGGRNQEFALSMVRGLSALDAAMTLASFGTDGIDGPTDAAGAFVDSSSESRSVARGIGSPEPYLDNNDAYRFFDPLGDLIHTGPTGTNVGDLQVLLVE